MKHGAASEHPDPAAAWALLDHAFRAVLTVPNEAVVRAEARARQQRAKKRAKKKD